jgi:O-antigen ligase
MLLKKNVETYGVLFSFYLLLLFIPVFKKAVPYAILLLILSAIFFLFKKRDWKIEISWKNTSIGWFLLWVLTAFSLLYSKNISHGLFDLEVKLSMIIFSLLFLFKTLRELLLQNIKNIFKIWIFATTLSIFFHVGKSLYNFLSIHPSLDEFFYAFLSRSFHPSYLAMYVLVAMVFIIEMYQQQIKPFASKTLTFVLLLLHGIFIFLLSSKANLLAFGIVSMILFQFFLKKRQWFLILTFLGSLAFLIILSKTQNIFMGRIAEIKYATTQAKKGTVETYSSTSERIVIWKSALELIYKHPLFGVGSGDVNDELNTKYIERNFILGAQRSFNVHNQFLQNWLCCGILGIGLLLYVMGLHFWQSIEHKNLSHFLFAMIIFLNLMFESMLETQSGVVFIVLMSVLLSSRKYP